MRNFLTHILEWASEHIAELKSIMSSWRLNRQIAASGASWTWKTAGIAVVGLSCAIYLKYTVSQGLPAQVIASPLFDRQSCLGILRLHQMKPYFAIPVRGANLEHFPQDNGTVKLSMTGKSPVQLSTPNGLSMRGTLAELYFDRSKRQRNFEMCLIHKTIGGLVETRKLRIRFDYPMRNAESKQAAALHVEWCKVLPVLGETCEELNLSPHSKEKNIPYMRIAVQDRIRLRLKHDGEDVFVGLKLLQLEHNRKRDANTDPAAGRNLVFHYLSPEEAPGWEAIAFQGSSDDAASPLQVEIQEVIGLGGRDHAATTGFASTESLLASESQRKGEVYAYPALHMARAAPRR